MPQMTPAEVAAEAQEVANMFVLSPAMPFSEQGVEETMTRLRGHPDKDSFTVLQVCPDVHCAIWIVLGGRGCSAFAIFSDLWQAARLGAVFYKYTWSLMGSRACHYCPTCGCTLVRFPFSFIKQHPLPRIS
jgi:hypothetical protein